MLYSQKSNKQDRQIVSLLVEAELELRRRSGDDEGIPALNFEDYQQHPARFGIELLGEHYTDDVIEVMRSIFHNPVTIAKSANAVGKTHGAARVATWFYKCFKDAQVYTTAAPPEKNLRRLLWGEIYSITNKHPELFFEDRITGDLHIQRNPQSFITGVAIPMAGTEAQREAKFSGKHAPHLLFIVDEADAVPHEVFKGIESCMSGGMARLLVMFNPRAEAGPVANMIRNRQGNVIELSAFSHPNVSTGTDMIPGAVTREKTIRRINEWARPLVKGEVVDNECFQLPEYLVGTTAQALDGATYPPLEAGWYKVTDPSFFYMVLGLYPPQSETQLISQAWIDGAVMRWKAYVAEHGEGAPLNITPTFGLDVADQGKDQNVFVKRYAGFVMRIKDTDHWGGVDPDMTAVRVAEKLSNTGHKKTEINLYVDATGVGAGVAPRIERLGYSGSKSIYVASAPTFTPIGADGEKLGEFYQLRDQLWWSCREWLRTDPGAMLPPDDDLHQELRTPSYLIDGRGMIRVSNKDTMRELLGRSPDKADALIMTFAPKPPVAGAMR